MESLHRKHSVEKLTKKDLRKITSFLLKQHTPSDPNFFETYQITKDEILTGVYCANCLSLPMLRERGKWVCSSCTFTSKDAHIHALHDYRYLFQPTITNKQMRHFLHIKSESTANKILVSMKIPYNGNTKGRIYDLTKLK
jgi:hypothetical protein